MVDRSIRRIVVTGLGLVTPLDLLVRTPAQVQERLRLEDPFMREIVQRGKVRYEADHRCRVAAG